VLSPGEYDRKIDKAAVCCSRCHYEPSDVAFCQVTLALVIVIVIIMIVIQTCTLFAVS